MSSGGSWPCRAFFSLKFGPVIRTEKLDVLPVIFGGGHLSLTV